MYARMRACARGILMLLSNNTSILSNNTSIIIFIPMLGINNTTGRFFIPPVVFSSDDCEIVLSCAAGVALVALDVVEDSTGYRRDSGAAGTGADDTLVLQLHYLDKA